LEELGMVRNPYIGDKKKTVEKRQVEEYK